MSTELLEGNEVISTIPSSEVRTTVLVLGKESVGKSRLISSLTGASPESSNFRGTTVSCEVYQGEGLDYMDTPGLVLRSDTATMALALAALEHSETVLLALHGAHLYEDLADLIPLVRGKKGVVVVTHKDQLERWTEANQNISALEKETGLSVTLVDGRQISGEDRARIGTALQKPSTFPDQVPDRAFGCQIEPRQSLFDVPFLGAACSLFLLFVPALLSVILANRTADALYPRLLALLGPTLERINQWPGPLGFIFGKSYGLVAMGPFLLLYALPTVLAFALLLALFKASGLLDRVTVSLDGLVRPFGLTGRDLMRVVMGFGCNVPAVVNSRSCANSTRQQTIRAIGFGAACSYQLPATLAVFSASSRPDLGAVYLGLLGVTSLVYLRVQRFEGICACDNTLFLRGRTILQLPTWFDTRREIWQVMRQFLFQALPIFFGICILASIVEWLGLLDRLGVLVAPVMKLFNLPSSNALAIILASIRKDGVMLLAKPEILSTMTGVQIVTAVFLAGSLLPCSVTILTILKEMKARFALQLVARQALEAVIFATLIAWGGKALFQ